MEQKGWDLAAVPTDLRSDVPSGTEHRQQLLLKLGDPSAEAVEAASPISTRPPAISHHHPLAQNLEEVSDDVEEMDRGGVSGGNRWPRQETLALLKVRSELDTAFRDATLKGPLWEDVSRKLAQMGYKRSAKKCREKFENVYKYYKRTKEGRAGRQDGKSYKFFNQLEALQHAAAASSANMSNLPIAATNLAVVSTGIGINCPMPASSLVVPLPPPMLPQVHHPPTIHPSDLCIERTPSVPIASTTAINFSSDSLSFPSSSSSEEEEEELEEEEMEMVMEIQGKLEGKPENTNFLRKRKRESSSRRRMREFLEGIMKEVMQKQEAMQQRFLEAIEKREHDRMIREEAWKRQEMARLAREHELMAKERAISASRDAAIITFLQKITGQTIHLPPPTAALIITTDPPPFNNIVPRTPQPSLSQQPSQRPQQLELQHQHHQSQIAAQVVVKHPSSLSNSEIVVAVEVPADLEHQLEMSSTGVTTSSLEASSSRWPKTEVMALIKLRSGLEWRFQEAGPKGPLWEEISAGMQQMGYKRSAKRCKEKWENINKYFKKVKESNKKRPQDSKTCPYFHQLDTLYQKKVLGNTAGIAIAIAGANTSTGHGN